MNLSAKKVVLIIVSIGSFLTPFMASSINIALPTIDMEFNMEAVLLSWVATSYLLSSAIFIVPFGKIGDIVGRKKIYIYGILTFTLSSLGCALSFSTTLLIFFRIIQGIGSAMLFGTGIAMLTSAYEANERGKAIGINTASIYIGLTAGPVIGGLLTNVFGWRSIFIINIPLGIIVLLLIKYLLKEEWSLEYKKFDYYGSFLYVTMLLMVIYGLSILPDYTGVLIIIMGITLSVFFIRWELKAKEPILNVLLFKNNRKFAISNFAAFITHSATFAVGFLISLYLQYIKGFNAGETGIILLFQPIVMVLFSIVAGRLSDKIESYILSSIGMLIISVSLIVFSFIREDTSILYIIICLIVLGIGMAIFAPPNVHAIMSSVERKFYGISSAMVGTMKITGQMISMAIATLVIGLYIGNVQIAPQNYLLFIQGEKVIFTVYSILCLGGFFSLLIKGREPMEGSKV
ncbi:UNVERIFIED_CONTAM: EmrB/QacA subfamily drug resistance transporter [Acetivibrio alkalicellulosi]